MRLGVCVCSPRERTARADRRFTSILLISSVGAARRVLKISDQSSVKMKNSVIKMFEIWIYIHQRIRNIPMNLTVYIMMGKYGRTEEKSRVEGRAPLFLVLCEVKCLLMKWQ